MGTRRASDEGASPDWKAEIEAFDAQMERQEAEFRAHTVLVDAEGLAELSEEENALLRLVLAGHTCAGAADSLGCAQEDVAVVLETVLQKLGPEAQRAISITLTRTDT